MNETLYHKKHGALVKGRREYKRLGNKFVQLWVDGAGNERELDGMETTEPLEVVPNKEIKEAKAEKKQDSRHSEISKGLKDLKTAIESQTKTEKESILGTLEDIKNKDFPKPIDFTKKLDEISAKISKLDEKVYTKELESIKKAVLSLDKEINLKPVVKAVENIKFPAIPKPTEPKNYTKLLEGIKKSLPKETDITPVVKAIKEIPQFEIPSDLIRKGRLKVEVDRTGGGEGGAPSPFEDADGGAVKANVIDGHLQVDVNDPLIEYKSAGMDVSANPYYFGYLKTDGSWYIKKLDTTLGTIYIKGDSNYTTAWSGRAGLSYDEFNVIF